MRPIGLVLFLTLVYVTAGVATESIKRNASQSTIVHNHSS